MNNNFHSEFFKGNRDRLTAVLPNSLIVISANSILQKSADTTFNFRQDSNFWYLSGIDHPDLCLIINTKNRQTTLLIPEQNDYQKQWDGQLDTLELQKISAIKDFKPITNLNSIVKDAKSKDLKICYQKPASEIVEPYGFYSNPARRKIEEALLQIEPELIDVRLEIARLRQVKQPIELEAIRSAIGITGSSLNILKKNLLTFKNEKELENSLSSLFYKFGANGHGFEPIIACGKNASIIHYRGNNQHLPKNQLILLDVGAQSGYYSADISRTWAIGTPSKRQTEIYSAVIELQRQAFKLLKPGILLKDYQHDMEELIKNKMKALKCKNAEEKYPHGISHFLGIDVHDAGDYNQPLSEGVVLTVEPGIYLQDEGIGVRIEDVVVITKNGVEILSKDIPKNL
jgi:Xaa-Pro aminopeptidase